MHDSITILEWGLCKVTDNISRFDEMKSDPLVNVAEEAAGESELCVNPLQGFIGER